MILFFMFTLLFIMNLAIIPFSFVLSIINMSIIAVLAAMTFFVMKNYENYLFNISKDIKNMFFDTVLFTDRPPHPPASGAD